MVSSHPVSDEDWLDVEINKLFCINNGKIYYEGYEHENEFIATPEQEEFMKSILDRLSDGDEEDWYHSRIKLDINQIVRCQKDIQKNDIKKS